MEREPRELMALLTRLGDEAPALDWPRLQASRRRLGRRRRALGGALTAVVAVGVVVGGLSLAGGRSTHRRIVITTQPTPSVSPSPTASPSPVNALPSSTPPAVPVVNLPSGGSPHAITGTGWSLRISQGGRGTVSISLDNAGGQTEAAPAPIAVKFYNSNGTTTAIPTEGLTGVTVASFTENGKHVIVVFGAALRGTAGVAAQEANGHRAWAQLIDPGPAFDTMFFAYESPDDGDVLAVQSVNTTGHVLSTVRIASATAQPTADPGQIAADGVVTTSMRKVPGDSSESFCLTAVATGAYQCMAYYITNDPLTVELRLGDGRLAVAGIAPLGYTNVNLTVTADRSVHPIRLGTDRREPLQFTWIGNAPQQASTTRLEQVPVHPSPGAVRASGASPQPFGFQRSPALVTFPGVNETVTYTNDRGQQLQGPRPGQPVDADGHPK